jgi:hypothetical protein
LNDTGVLKLELDPKDVLFPSKYKKNRHIDIALMGLSRQNKFKLNPYI